MLIALHLEALVVAVALSAVALRFGEALLKLMALLVAMPLKVSWAAVALSSVAASTTVLYCGGVW